MTNATTQESLEREGSSLSPENLPFELEFSTMKELPEIGVSSHGVFVTNPQYDAGMTQKVDPVECWGISHAHAQLIVDLNEELAEAVEDALNTACLRLQKTAGIKDGGFAGTFFSGHPIRRELMNVLAEYIAGDVNSCRSETKGFLLTKEMIAEAIGGKDLKTYDGWLEAASALLADAPSWTAIQQPCGLFAVKVSDGSLAGVFWCADHGDVSHVYREDELADFDRSAWAGDSWDGLSSQDNEACLRNPVFVALRHI